MKYMNGIAMSDAAYNAAMSIVARVTQTITGIPTSDEERTAILRAVAGELALQVVRRS